MGHFSTRRAGVLINARQARKLVSQRTKSVMLDKTNYPPHRIIWKMVYGVDPPDVIDHINGDSRDNRLNNLRAVSQKENARNMKMSRSNTSGHTGVGVDSSGRGWGAHIKVDGKTHRLGTFDTFEEAVAARKTAERRFGFHPNHGRLEVSQGDAPVG